MTDTKGRPDSTHAPDMGGAAVLIFFAVQLLRDHWRCDLDAVVEAIRFAWEAVLVKDPFPEQRPR